MVYKMDIFKILGIIFITAVIGLILKSYRPEYSLALTAVAAVIVLTFILKGITSPILLIEKRINESGIDSNYFKVALKSLGIGYITSFIAEACRDCGQNSLALKAELAGKCAIFILSAPLILSILETALKIVQ